MIPNFYNILEENAIFALLDNINLSNILILSIRHAIAIFNDNMISKDSNYSQMR